MKEINYNKISVVITTINKLNPVIKKLNSVCKKNNADFIIIGDIKTPDYPKNYPLIDISKQKQLKFKLAKKTPINSYTRKNLGYLISMKSKSKIIIETDDDNLPKNNFFKNLRMNITTHDLSGPKWINIFKYLVKNKTEIWPRGYPLPMILDEKKIKKKLTKVISPIQNRMCDNEPDVDSIFRLTKKSKQIYFYNKSYSINFNSICPFNSQNTLWFEVAFPLLYLPSYCNMRATDIWRSFIAQRISKIYKWRLSFSGPSVTQLRNKHNLMEDFKDEYDVFSRTLIFNKILNSLKLSNNYNDILINLIKCYEKLVEEEFFNKKELDLVYRWAYDLGKLYPKLNLN